jgi:urease accessory protein
MLLALEPPAEAGSPAQNGSVELVLERRAGQTRLACCRTRPPLLVQKALYPDEAAPDLAHVFLANPTGGLLQNDRHDIAVSVGDGARAHVTTQSATKVYTMPEGSAEQRVRLNVASGGYLEYLPDPLIPYRDASLIQKIEITCEPGGALLFSDVITPGRVAMGESFRFRRLSNRLTVWGQGRRPVYREGFDLDPRAGDLIGIGVLGFGGRHDADDPSARTLGSMLIVCDSRCAPSMLDQVRHSLGLSRGVLAGASMLPDRHGVGVKMIGQDCASVRQAMTRAWSIARQELLGVAAPALRKY